MPAAATLRFQPGSDIARLRLPDLRLRLCALCAGHAHGQLGEYRQLSKGRVFEPEMEQPTARSALLVSSVRVTHVGTHDRVRVWVRGALAGELIVPEHDGAFLARELGLHEVGGAL